jgi:hypothetical protein
MEVVGKRPQSTSQVLSAWRGCAPGLAATWTSAQAPTTQAQAQTPHTHPDMSALPRSIGSRLLPAAARPSVARVIAPRYRTFTSGDASTEVAPKTSSGDAPNAPLTESAQDSQTGAADAMRHKPDYNVAVDYRTSYVHHEATRHGIPDWHT